jgi:hypothetical protein
MGTNIVTARCEVAAGDTYFVVEMLISEHGFRSIPGDLGLRVIVPFQSHSRIVRYRPGPVMMARFQRAGQPATTSATVHDLVVAAIDDPGPSV